VIKNESPHISVGEVKKNKVKRIVGKIRFGCEVTPERHTVHAWLEYQTGETWTRMTDVQTDGRAIVPNKENTMYAALDGCRNGGWRTVAYADGSLQGKSFNSGNEVSKALKITGC
jgi:hypothetical protein